MVTKSNAPKITWDKAVAAPVVLISGPENFLADRAFEKIKTELLEADPSLLQHNLVASDYAAGTLLTLASPSLFGEPRLIRVEGVEKSNDQFITDGKAYLQSPDSDTTVVFRHAGGVRGKAVLDAIRKSGNQAVEILCPEIKPADRMTLVQGEFSRRGVRASGEAVRMLLDAYQADIEELMSVVRQLVSIADGEVTINHVTDLTGGRVEANAFRVADAAVSGNAKEAIVLLRQSLSTGTTAFPLLGALNLKVRTMAKVMGARGSSGQLAKTFSIAPWQADRALRDIRGWRESDLAKAVDLGAETEWLMKGGTKDPVFALEKYVLFIARKGRTVK